MFYHLTLIILVFIVSCGEQAQQSSDSSLDETEVKEYRNKVGTTTEEEQAKQQTKKKLRKDYQKDYPDLPIDSDFSILSPAEYINQTSFQAKWSIPYDVKDYDVIVSRLPNCPIGSMILTRADYTEQVLDIGPLPEGIYFLCIQAILWGGKQLYAKNNSFQFIIDLTPPSTFSIDPFKSPTADELIELSWTKASGADFYKVSVAKESSCETKVKEFVNISDPKINIGPLEHGNYKLCIEAWDKAGNYTPADGSPFDLQVDKRPPQIINIQSLTGNGEYKEGEQITIRVSFDEELILSADTAPNIELLLNSEGKARYLANEGNYIDFTYTINSAENAPNLELRNFKAGPNLILNGAVISDKLGIGTVEDYTVIETWLSANHKIEIDTDPPLMQFLSKPADLHFSSTAIFEVNCNDEPCSYEASLNDGEWRSITSPYSLTDLTQGSYTIKFHAIDAAGNKELNDQLITFSVDLYQPTTTVSDSPPAKTAQTIASFTFTCSESFCYFFAQLDDGQWQQITSPHTIQNLSDGTHTLNLYSKDAIGRTDASPEQIIWQVDTTAPKSQITTNLKSSSSDSNANFTFSCNETCTYKYSLNSGSLISLNNNALSLANLNDGSYTLKIYATDDVGNAESTPSEFSWKVDTKNPNTGIDTSPPTLTNSTSATFDANCDEDQCSYERRLDNGDWIKVDLPETITNLSEGPHIYELKAIDSAGNKDASAESVSWTIDISSPQTNFDTTPQASVTSKAATFTFSCHEPPCTFEGSLDGETWINVTNPHSRSNLSEGSHTFRVRATDAAGNIDTTPASYSWTIDTTPPDTSLSLQPSSFSKTNSATFEFDCSGGPCTFEGRLDSGAWNTITSPHTLNGLSEGSHTFAIRAMDSLLNVDASSASVSWIVDTIIPDTTIDSSPLSAISSQSATFTFSSPENNCSFQGRLDGGSWMSITSPHTLSSLTEASHTFEIRSIDQAGNFDTTPASFSFKVDLTAPNTTIDSHPSSTTNLSSTTFAFSCDDSPCTFEYRLNNGSWTTVTSPHSFSATSGTNTYEVRAKDEALNTDQSQASYSWTLDVTDPSPGGSLSVASNNTTSIEISWNEATDNNTVQSELQYIAYFSTSNNISTVSDAKANGTSFGSYSTAINSKTITNLVSDVTYYINILVKDKAGNEASYNQTSQRVGALPKFISNLQAWYDANEISAADTSEILTVDDRSSQNHDATAPQASEGPNIYYNQVNGRKVLRFDGNDSLDADSIASSLSNNQALTIFIVTKQTNVGENEYIFSTHDNADADLEPIKLQYSSACSGLGELNLVIEGNLNYSTCENDVGNFLLISAVITTNAKVYKNGALVIDQSGVNPTFSNIDRVIFGAQFDAGFTRTSYLDGDIAEVIIYNRALNNTERHQLEAFLANRYNLSVVEE